MRKKLRTTLTVLSIVVAFVLFGALGSINAAFTQGAEIAGADRLITIHRVSLIQSLPYSYVQRVRGVDGVARVSHANWFGGYYQEPRNQFAQLAVDAESYFDIYSDVISLPEEQMQAWRRNRMGAVIGTSLAERFGWEVGDRVPLMSMFTREGGQRNWEFVIEGIFTAESSGADSGSMLFHYQYFDEAREWDKGTVGWLMIEVEDPDQAARVAEEVDALFANSPAETRTSTEKAFVEAFLRQFGDIGTITTLILGAVFFTMLLVAANTMSQAVRERIPEMAILKTLGFTNHSVLLMILAESLLMVLIGGGLGLLLAGVLVQGAAGEMAAFLPGFHMPSSVWRDGLIAMAIMGLLAGMAPAVKGMRLNIVTALGRR
ncbi:ABC transporter permease [Marinimicrobium sp. ABcell2]|uniref:ABC transporter permease n=1 Tax=Marinimicrobium sp. ABcell2 TaxID=3069751 RepID=UPI0027ADBA80|nr:ABC transporter permease [Marinimicrobium sp. ABcell2]MDQ2075852.1 ABC transporter permease [Marinimicrobium sp. ABcell2]